MEYTYAIDKECKHSRRYICKDEDCPITQIYVKRAYADERDSITLEIKEEEKK